MPWWKFWDRDDDDDEPDPNDPNDQRNYPQWDEGAGDWDEEYDPFSDDNDEVWG